MGVGRCGCDGDFIVCQEVAPFEMNDYVSRTADLQALVEEIFLQMAEKHRRSIREMCGRVETLSPPPMMAHQTAS